MTFFTKIGGGGAISKFTTGATVLNFYILKAIPINQRLGPWPQKTCVSVHI